MNVIPSTTKATSHESELGFAAPPKETGGNTVSPGIVPFAGDEVVAVVVVEDSASVVVLGVLNPAMIALAMLCAVCNEDAALS